MMPIPPIRLRKSGRWMTSGLAVLLCAAFAVLWFWIWRPVHKSEAYIVKNPSKTPYTLTVHYLDGPAAGNLGNDSFSKPGHRSPRFRTRPAGHLQIDFVIRTQGKQIADKLDIPERRDWEWAINFYVQKKDPAYGCFGCLREESYDIPGLTGVKAYVVLSGNSISNPVNY